MRGITKSWHAHKTAPGSQLSLPDVLAIADILLHCSSHLGFNLVWQLHNQRERKGRALGAEQSQTFAVVQWLNQKEMMQLQNLFQDTFALYSRTMISVGVGGWGFSQN